MKTQGKWEEENQTVDKTKDTEISGNREGAREQEEGSNTTKESKTTPFISPVWAFAGILGAITYARRK